VAIYFFRHTYCFLLACIPPEVYNAIKKEKAMKRFIAGGTGFMGKCLPIVYVTRLTKNQKFA